MADKFAAIQDFWGSFGLQAFDENSVPSGSDRPPFPYITYNANADSIGNDVSLSGSLWYRSASWAEISRKAEEIERFLYEQKSPVKIDGGYLWLKRGSPFAQRMGDPSDDLVRRIYINVTAEFLTAY